MGGKPLRRAFSARIPDDETILERIFRVLEGQEKCAGKSDESFIRDFTF